MAPKRQLASHEPARYGPRLAGRNRQTHWPLDLQPGEVQIEEIAHALSNICRFGGRCSEFYSVAQHSVLVATIVAHTLGRPDLELAGLMHDAAEAYLGDIPTPLKRHVDLCGEPFGVVENRVLRAILLHLRLSGTWDEGRPESLLLDVFDPAIKEADGIALATESRDLMGSSEWGSIISMKIGPLSPEAACRSFLAAWERLTGREVSQ